MSRIKTGRAVSGAFKVQILKDQVGESATPFAYMRNFPI